MLRPEDQEERILRYFIVAYKMTLFDALQKIPVRILDFSFQTMLPCWNQITRMPVFIWVTLSSKVTVRIKLWKINLQMGALWAFSIKESDCHPGHGWIIITCLMLLQSRCYLYIWGRKSRSVWKLRTWVITYKTIKEVPARFVQPPVQLTWMLTLLSGHIPTRDQLSDLSATRYQNSLSWLWLEGH